MMQESVFDGLQNELDSIKQTKTGSTKSSLFDSLSSDLQMKILEQKRLFEVLDTDKNEIISLINARDESLIHAKKSLKGANNTERIARHKLIFLQRFDQLLATIDYQEAELDGDADNGEDADGDSTDGDSTDGDSTDGEDEFDDLDEDSEEEGEEDGEEEGEEDGEEEGEEDLEDGEEEESISIQDAARIFRRACQTELREALSSTRRTSEYAARDIDDVRKQVHTIRKRNKLHTQLLELTTTDG